MRDAYTEPPTESTPTKPGGMPALWPILSLTAFVAFYAGRMTAPIEVFPVHDGAVLQECAGSRGPGFIGVSCENQTFSPADPWSVLTVPKECDLTVHDVVIDIGKAEGMAYILDVKDDSAIAELDHINIRGDYWNGRGELFP